MKKIIIPLLSLFLFSCNNEDKGISNIDPETSFPKEINLKHAKVDEIKQLNPFRLCLFDSILVVNDAFENNRIHFYNKNTLQEIASFAKQGEGPVEFDMPESLTQYNKAEKKGSFYIYELSKGILSEIDMAKVLKKESNPIVQKTYLNPDLIGSDNLFIFNDSITGEKMFGDYDFRYFSMNKKTSKYRAIELLEETDFIKSALPDDKRNLDRSFLGYNKERKKFVAAYLHFNKIKIYDDKLKGQKTIYYGDDEITPKSTTPFNKENIRYFLHPFMGKSYFYVPYNGKNNESDSNREIHVFNYEGEPVARISLDMPMINFTVDEETKTIYTITGDEKNVIVKYHFNL
ncbi:MAG TPA: BF3164 family lipoprotein [Flavobacterium sp.]|uniref:BF3164 family lipoprotein n=1 Tax=Flavobacterium sp. TaxID=239 RepID=UPI002C06DFF1|nr:BF3164 family lipoprotein [Flavobacterium sp.]HSD15095.1 BF3164 family lipoprotein [Flavobacterium sp.]